MVLSFFSHLSAQGRDREREGGRELEHLLLCRRAQQKAPRVPMRTMSARKAPTATPMMTAKRRDPTEDTHSPRE